MGGGRGQRPDSLDLLGSLASLDSLIDSLLNSLLDLLLDSIVDSLLESLVSLDSLTHYLIHNI